MRFFPVVLAALILFSPARAHCADPAISGDISRIESVADQAILDKVETYFNTIRSLKAHIVQVASTGAQAEGTLYIQRPGKMRLTYEPPMPVEIVADGKQMIYHDKKLEQVSHLSMNATPAGMLLQEKLSFSDPEITITDVHRQPGIIEISLMWTEDPTAGELTLVFQEDPIALKEWRVRDAQGVVTTVGLFEVKTNLPLSADLFEFKKKKKRNRRRQN